MQCDIHMLSRLLFHHLNENVLFTVPHFQYVFSIPKMLRICFKCNCPLLDGICRCGYKSLLTFLREVVGLKEGVSGAVMAIHTFGAEPLKGEASEAVLTGNAWIG